MPVRPNRENLPCAVVPDQILNGVRVSSTYIRQQLEDGDMATAVKFLGHPHILSGTVVHGKALGRKLGIPTANLQLPEGLAVTNIGTRPTVAGSGITVEPWILDYSGDLYGREITLEFHYFLRPEKKFPSLDALQKEIRQNALETRTYLQTMFTF